MSKEKPKGVKITSFSLRYSIWARLNRVSTESGIPATKIVEKAITEYLDKNEERLTNNDY